MKARLRVFEIFQSISGEHSIFPQGSMCNFIRLAGCNLSCRWCDSVASTHSCSGEIMCFDQILAQLNNEIKNVILTGGEPLLQEQTNILLPLLKNKGYLVSIETNGSVYPSKEIMESADCLVLDHKLPSSGNGRSRMLSAAQYADIAVSHPSVYIKFVVADEKDFIFAMSTMSAIMYQIYSKYGEEDVEKAKANIPIFLFSPILGVYNVQTLFDNLVSVRGYNALINVQLHKLVDMA